MKEHVQEEAPTKTRDKHCLHSLGQNLHRRRAGRRNLFGNSSLNYLVLRIETKSVVDAFEDSLVEHPEFDSVSEALPKG